MSCTQRNLHFSLWTRYFHYPYFLFCSTELAFAHLFLSLSPIVVCERQQIVDTDGSTLSLPMRYMAVPCVAQKNAVHAIGVW